AVPSSDLGHKRLADPRLAFVWLRLKRLEDLGVTAPMVMKEFLRHRVAPLQPFSADVGLVQQQGAYEAP
ncbi:hypothetical protein KC217_20765, partial [Mycobacterium tuberculosis]|nr:hypothetical protein [Mycobacterium tuberculosis]